MNKLAIPLGVVWVVFSLILGIVLVMTPETQTPVAVNQVTSQVKKPVSTGVKKSAPVAEKSVNNSVKTKTFVAGTSDDATSVSAKVVK